MSDKKIKNLHSAKALDDDSTKNVSGGALPPYLTIDEVTQYVGKCIIPNDGAVHAEVENVFKKNNKL